MTNFKYTHTVEVRNTRLETLEYAIRDMLVLNNAHIIANNQRCVNDEFDKGERYALMSVLNMIEELKDQDASLFQADGVSDDDFFFMPEEY